MKSVKLLFLSALLALSVIIANAQGVSNINEATFFKAKYKKDKVWDVQRLPAYPIASQDWTLSGLKGSLDSDGNSVDWGQDRYVMMVAEPDNSNDVNSLVNDVNSTGGKYMVSLQLFESNGTLVKVLSKWGKIAGIGEKGFMYECEGQYGTFFSVAAVPPTTVITYKPTLAVISKLSEIITSSSLTRSLEKENGISESSFFSNKYTKENVWDVQRLPAYPVPGQVWTLSGLKGSLDANRANVDWGTGRYVMLIAEVDNAKNANSLIDDINNNGTKLNISLKLYESTGVLVKVISNWGKIYGIGAEGFMYEVEGKYGTFFSVARVSATDVIKYKPNLAAITKLSELTKGLDAVKSPENLKVTENVKVDEPLKAPEIIKGVTDAPLFTNKYTKERVWDVMRMPIFITAGKEWTLSKLKSAIEASGSPIDWGTGRYVMFVAQVAGAGSLYPLTDDVNNSGKKYNVSLRLFENDGTFVKVVSAWGRFLGFGDKGFVYETEGKYNELFAAGAQNANDVIKYMPSLAKASKLSELVKLNQTAQVSELPKENGSKINRENENENGSDLGKVNEDNTGKGSIKQSEAAFFKVKYTKDMVWQVNEVWTIPGAGTIRTLNIKGRANENRGPEGDYELVDWGNNGDRYMTFNVSDKKSNNAENYGIPIDFIVSLFERNGTLVSELYSDGNIVGLGDKGFEFQMVGGLVIFFSKKALKETDVINNKITLPKVDKLSQLGK